MAIYPESDALYSWSMKTLTILGQAKASIQYDDRPTVKVVIFDGDNVLIMNGGTLPGGGINFAEDNNKAVRRELSEEIGASIGDATELGSVIQFRDFLSKKYIVYGYVADLVQLDRSSASPEEYEIDFTFEWVRRDDVVTYIENAISKHTKAYPELKNDAEQGRLFNLQTSLVIVTAALNIVRSA